jgi:hypothetical protein|eukprot:COSAG02_NODE_6690_length_3419_cov_2.998193_3_plen_87_part_00
MTTTSTIPPTAAIATTGAASSCSETVVGGAWYGKLSDVFAFDEVVLDSSPLTVKLDISNCHHCSFDSAAGSLTKGGVELTLKFKPG